MYKYKFLQVGQLPLEHLSFLQNPLSFFKAPVASIIGDIEIYQCHIKRQWRCYPQWRSALSLLLQSCFYCPTLMTVAPL